MFICKSNLYLIVTSGYVDLTVLPSVRILSGVCQRGFSLWAVVGNMNGTASYTPFFDVVGLMVSPEAPHLCLNSNTGITLQRENIIQDHIKMR